MMILNNDKHISTRGGGLCGLSDTFQIIVVPEIGVAPSSKLSSVLSESAGYFVFRHLACKLTQLRRRFDLWHSNIVFSASSLRNEEQILVERSNSALAHFFY